MAAANGERVSPMWLTAMYLLHTVGELCLSPVGLSAMTKLAPERVTGLVMGVWFLGPAIANYISGRLAGFYESMPLSELFGYVTAALASFFVGREAQSEAGELASAAAMRALHEEIAALRRELRG